MRISNPYSVTDRFPWKFLTIAKWFRHQLAQLGMHVKLASSADV